MGEDHGQRLAHLDLTSIQLHLYPTSPPSSNLTSIQPHLYPTSPLPNLTSIQPHLHLTSPPSIQPHLHPTSPEHRPMERNSFSTMTRLALHKINWCIIPSTPAGKDRPPLKDTCRQRAIPQRDSFTQGMTYRGGLDVGEPRSPHHGCTGHETQSHHHLCRPAS